MAKYEVNTGAVERASRLITARQYVLDSDWGRIHKAIEPAAHNLLQELDAAAGITE